MTPTRQATARRERLSREQIARAALDYLDRHGLAELSMRRLARELGVAPMSLYNYFPTKRELLDAVAEAAFAGQQVTISGAGWREQLTSLATAARAALDRHPCVVQIRILQPVLDPQSLQFAEAGLRILEDAGFPPEEAAKAFRLLFTYTMGFAGFSPAASEQSAHEAAEAALSGLPAEYFPRLSVAIAEAADAMGGDAVFAYGLDRILDGLESRLAML